ncbi:ATP-binding protein [soil metagenome]
MRVLLLQLSDIHVRDRHANPALSRAERVADAVKNLDYQLDLCVILLSGDMAYAGAEAEYLQVGDLIEAVRDQLSRALCGSLEVAIVGVPGNHDCRLLPPLPARSALINSILGGAVSIDDAVIQACTEVQDAFFSFLDGISGAAREGNRLSYHYRLRVGDEVLHIQAYNSAWLSEIYESPGAILFPIDQMPASRPDADTVISIIHHPFNWMPASGNHREFRARVEATSDLVITGHEHTADLREIASTAGHSLYVEGGALQDHENADSRFLAVILDTKRAERQVRVFAWDGARYAEERTSDWAPLMIQTRARPFTPLPETEQWLNDLEMTFPHPVEGDLQLPDIFVYPDLREVTNTLEESPRTILGEALVSELAAYPHLLITGPEKCGKTALLKTLFRDLLARGSVPLVLNGRTTRLKPERLNDEMEELCRSTYGEKAVEAFRQIDRSLRVVFVDEAHYLHERKGSVSEFLSALCQAAGRVVLLSNDLVQALAEAGHGGPLATGTAQFRHLHIQQFGHARRHKLVEQWCMLDPMLRQDAAALARRVLEIKRVLDQTIGKSFVPSYPVFLLPLLLAQSRYQAVNLNASTYGYFFELLIRNALTKGTSQGDVDALMAYLTFLANALFRSGRIRVSDRELRDIHNAYEEAKLAEENYVKMVRELLRRGILVEIAEQYEFRYSYIRYYFTARALADTIGTTETQAVVDELCQTLAEEEPANILLFLAYLSRDQSVLNGILDQAELIFAVVDEADLSGRTGVHQDVETAYKNLLEYRDRPAIEAQRERMQNLDKKPEPGVPSSVALVQALSEGELEDLQVAMDAVQDIIRRFATAIKTLQILGQTVKNSPASMDAEEKLRIVDAAYRLGLRTLQALHMFVHGSTDALVQGVNTSLREADPYTPQSDVVRTATSSIHGMLHITAFGMIRRIAIAVGARRLRPVYRRLAEQRQSPARDLIQMALTLEQFNESFPQPEVRALADSLENSSPMAYEVLRHLVYDHLHLFEVDYDEKQATCKRLDISYVKVRQINPSQRLLLKSDS